MSFDRRLLSAEPFVPHAYETLGNTFPPGAVPEPAYRQLCEKYARLEGVSVQRIVYLSDGLKVTGLMALPGSVQKRAHPLLIYNRGGNREYGKLTVSSVMRSMAPFAEQGYLVFASNYRGNDGGEGREEFGGADIADVLTLLDIARHHPGWDGKNTFMLGHSRGGMMTYRAIAEGVQLNAAIAIAAPSNIRASEEERPEMRQNVHNPLIPADTEEARQREYAKRSAVCWPEKLATPLLLLHGDADDRVDVSHSVKLAEKLQEAGMPYKLVIYPRGNHALVRNWKEVIAQSLEWLARYTSG